jgi:Rieske [2Fe-2S] domain
MANYLEVADVEQLPPGRGTVVTVEGKDVALFNVDGTVYAIEDACLHHGMSLGTSKLEGKIVTCRGRCLPRESCRRQDSGCDRRNFEPGCLTKMSWLNIAFW